MYHMPLSGFCTKKPCYSFYDLYQSSYYNSTVSSSPASAIRHTEILSRSDGFRGYGSDIGGGKTADLLLYLQERFGSVTSFSGSYRASRWELNIKRRAGLYKFYVTCTNNCLVQHLVYIECGWSNTACENLSPPANGRVDISSLEPETTVRYSCNVGFQLSGLRFSLVGQSVRTCEQSGSWSGEPPVCVASVSGTSPPKSDTSTSSSSNGKTCS